MSTEDDLLREILAYPAADEDRKLYGELLERRGDPRGELIRIQLELHRGFMTEKLPPGYAALVKREAELLRLHGDDWSRDVRPLVDRVELERGFVDHVTLSVDAFLERAAEIYRVAPVIHLTLTDAGAPGRCEALFASPHLARIRALNLEDNGIGDAGVAALAASPHLGKLRWLDLSRNGITRVGIEALVASPDLERLGYVKLSGNAVPDPTDTPAAVDGMEILEWESSPLASELEARHGPRRWLHRRVSHDLFRMARMGAIL
jgi:uncharacterized protein (TIGR02996 family)